MREIIDRLQEKRQAEIRQRLNEGSKSKDDFIYDGDSSQVPKDVTSVIVKQGVTAIGEYAFFNCEFLESIVIPDSVTSISDGVFERCDSLQSINIPNSVTKIGKWAFSHCRSLKSVVIPNSVTKIDERVFAGCESLKSVIIPDSVTSIKKYAFSYCTSLELVTIPDSVKFINDGAFYQCNNLKEVILRNPDIKYEEDSFPKHTKIIKGSSNVKESYRIELAKKLLESRGYEVRKLDESKDLEKALDFCKKKGWTPEEGLAYYKKQKDKLESERKKVEAELMKGDGWNSNVGTPQHAYHERLAGRIYNYMDKIDALENYIKSGTLHITVKDAETKYADKLFKMEGIGYGPSRVKGTKLIYGHEFGKYFGDDDVVLTILARSGDVYEIIDRE